MATNTTAHSHHIMCSNTYDVSIKADFDRLYCRYDQPTDAATGNRERCNPYDHQALPDLGQISIFTFELQNATISDVQRLQKPDPTLGLFYLQVWIHYKRLTSYTGCTITTNLHAIIKRSSFHFIHEPPGRIHC